MKNEVVVNKTSSQKLRALIRNELTRRFQKNPSYSLRAFAKSAGIDQSLLSKILKGERSLSLATALKLGQSVGLSMNQLQEILTKESDQTESSYKTLNEDQFMIVSEWLHFAILELMQTTNFKPDVVWIAKRLGVNSSEVTFALERLESCGFVKRVSPKRWICTAPNNSWFNGSHSNLARRSLQQQLLEKARASVETVGFEKRENASLTIAVDKSLLPEIKKRIHKFKDEINELAMSHGRANEVYQTCIAFFPLTDLEKK
jgi:uncharacterized protein (TIGR02147 family)